ncbi:uncharacterized protein LOC117162223 [Bombus vancouverensis nearcticus]|uniref:uncharacterized protein LOC117162223 n=1 Tax=Bombus vancouverensis nearcticus TaxID=2705178 RepID=UPI00143B0476|nr:uncharacterized protein LOC117162223 [Bombus vancouverensis nearcticus]
MGEAACIPPKTKGTSRIREPATGRRQDDNARDLPQEEERITSGADGQGEAMDMDLAIRESRVFLAMVAEPYCILDTPNWVADLDGLAAMTWMSAPSTSAAEILLEQGKGYAAIEWAGMVVVGIYVSLNSGLVAFEEFLDVFSDCVRRYLSRQVLVLGDFNAHSSQWGTQGQMLGAGCYQTGLRASGSSYLTEARQAHAWHGEDVPSSILHGVPPNAFRRVSGWRVAEGVETLAVHLYIFFEVGPETIPARQTCGIRGMELSSPPPRWRLKDRDNEMLQTAASDAA